MAFFDVEDTYGAVHVICFPKDYEKFGSRIDDDMMVQVTGYVTLDRETSAPQVSVKEICPMSQVPARICINFQSEEAVSEKNNILKEIQANKPGKSSIAIYVNKKNTKKIMSGFSNDAIDDLKQICGDGQVIVQM